MECTHVPIASALPRLPSVLHDDVAVHGAGIERTTNRPCAVVHDRPEDGPSGSNTTPLRVANSIYSLIGGKATG